MPNGGGFDRDTKPPFDQYDIKRGQKRGGGGGLFGFMNMTQPEKVVGILKVTDLNPVSDLRI